MSETQSSFDPASQSFRNRFFLAVAHIAARRSRWVVGISFLLALVGGLYGAATVEMVSDTDRLLSEDLLYHRRYRDFIRRYGDLEYIYIVIEDGEDADKIQFAERLSEKLNRNDGYFREVVYRFDTSWARRHALAYMPLADLQNLVNGLSDESGRLERLGHTPTLNDALEQLCDGIDTSLHNQNAPASSGDSSSDFFQAFDADDLRDLTEALEGREESAYSELSQLTDEIRSADTPSYEYFWSESHRFLLMLVMPEKDYTTLGVIDEPLKLLREAVKEAELEMPGVHAGLTGRPVLQADEMRTTNRDMMRAGVFSFVGVVLVFMFFFREFWRPIFAGLSLLTALGWTYGFVAVTVGHLNLLSAVFAIVLVGLGIDFGIHVVHRYQEELKITQNPEAAAESTLLAIGSGLLSAGLTSASPFFLAMATDFLGLAELGWIAGSGIVFCLISMTVLLLAMMTMYDRRMLRQEKIHEPLHLPGLRHASRHPKTVLGILAVLAVFSWPYAGRVHFDDNLLELQAQGLESVEYEQKLIHESGNSTWFCVFLRSNLEKVRSLHQRLLKNPLVGNVESLADVLPADMESKPELQKQLLQALPNFDFPEPAFQPNPEIIQRTVQSIDALLEGIAKNGDPEPWRRVPSLGLLARLRDVLKQTDAPERVRNAHRVLLQEPREIFRILHKAAAEEPLSFDSLPVSLKRLFVGRDGSLLVRAYPENDVWQEDHMADFVREMRLLDETVAGTPIQVYESSHIMRRAFLFAGGYALIAVVVLVFLDFYSWRMLVLCLAPLAAGVFYLVICMGATGTNLNLANFFAVPILLGIGVDNAIHLLHRFQETGSVEDTVHTTGTTLTLTSLTTTIGFGSLLLAHHRGLQSLGGLMVLGVLSCWFASLVLLPNLLEVIPQRFFRVSHPVRLNE